MNPKERAQPLHQTLVTIAQKLKGCKRSKPGNLILAIPFKPNLKPSSILLTRITDLCQSVPGFADYPQPREKSVWKPFKQVRCPRFGSKRFMELVNDILIKKNLHSIDGSLDYSVFFRIRCQDVHHTLPSYVHHTLPGMDSSYHFLSGLSLESYGPEEVVDLISSCSDQMLYEKLVSENGAFLDLRAVAFHVGNMFDYTQMNNHPVNRDVHVKELFVTI